MKVSVTPVCTHRASIDDKDQWSGPIEWTSQGEPFEGRSMTVTLDGVWVDGQQVIRRDRRSKKDRQPGHHWLTSNGHADPNLRNIGWTGFRVEVEP